MKVSIVAAVTLDGFIARSAHDNLEWISKEDKQSAKAISTKAGVVIMGRHTFDVLDQPLLKRRNIVMTHNPQKHSPQPRTEFTSESPRHLISRLSKEGYSEVVVYGGEKIFELFLTARLITTIWLTINPHIFGKGVRFPYEAIKGKAKVQSSKPMGPNEYLYKFKLTTVN